jgi:hypothetical protein
MAEKQDSIEMGRKIADRLRSTPSAAVAALKSVSPAGEERLASDPEERPQSGAQGRAVSPGE